MHCFVNPAAFLCQDANALFDIKEVCLFHVELDRNNNKPTAETAGILKESKCEEGVDGWRERRDKWRREEIKGSKGS